MDRQLRKGIVQLVSGGMIVKAGIGSLVLGAYLFANPEPQRDDASSNQLGLDYALIVGGLGVSLLGWGGLVVPGVKNVRHYHGARNSSYRSLDS